jgi:hypothetical protein
VVLAAVAVEDVEDEEVVEALLVEVLVEMLVDVLVGLQGQPLNGPVHFH